MKDFKETEQFLDDLQEYVKKKNRPYVRMACTIIIIVFIFGLAFTLMISGALTPLRRIIGYGDLYREEYVINNIDPTDSAVLEVFGLDTEFPQAKNGLSGKAYYYSSDKLYDSASGDDLGNFQKMEFDGDFYKEYTSELREYLKSKYPDMKVSEFKNKGVGGYTSGEAWLYNINQDTKGVYLPNNHVFLRLPSAYLRGNKQTVFDKISSVPSKWYRTDFKSYTVVNDYYFIY